jgi:hypothetical protein
MDNRPVNQRNGAERPNHIEVYPEIMHKNTHDTDLSGDFGEAKSPCLKTVDDLTCL